MSRYEEKNLEYGEKETVQRQEPEERERLWAIRLMEALSGVDEELLERCERDDRRTSRGNRAGIPGRARPRPIWQNARAWAAVLCLAVVGAASWGGYQLSQMKMGSADSSGGAASFLEEARDEAKVEEEAVPRDAVSGDTAPQGAEAGCAPEAGQGQETNRQPEGDIPMAEKEADEVGMPNQETAIEEETDSDGGAAQETDTEGQAPDAEVDSCPLPPQSQKFALAQAREDAVLGAYVPTELPAGYAFEEAYRVTEKTEANLALCWTRGLDSIMLHLERTANPPATVDVERTEIYDQRLYDVPYGETVPREYWQTFDNPVFAAEDLSLEIIKSRMKSYDDKGDTDTPRGNFSVLYEDGVLIRFSGRGTPEEIWEMFCSIGEKITE